MNFDGDAFISYAQLDNVELIEAPRQGDGSRIFIGPSKYASGNSSARSLRFGVIPSSKVTMSLPTR